MLDRIRRKLFLSLKVMTTNPSSGAKETEENAQQFKMNELMSILRKGTSVISREETGFDFARFMNAPIDAILAESRAREGVRDARMKKELGTEGGATDVSAANPEESGKLLENAEEEERRLLSGVAQFRVGCSRVRWSIVHRTTRRLPMNGKNYKSAHESIDLSRLMAKYTLWRNTWDAMR